MEIEIEKKRISGRPILEYLPQILNDVGLELAWDKVKWIVDSN